MGKVLHFSDIHIHPHKRRQDKGAKMAKEQAKKPESKKVDTNLQKAILDIASNLKKSFAKYSRSTRDKAWSCRSR